MALGKQQRGGSVTDRQEKSLFIFGFGFSSLSIARRAKGDFGKICGTTRSREKMNAIEKEDVIPVLFGGEEADPSLADHLAAATHLLISIGPYEAGDPVLDALEAALSKADKLEWIGYLSTVGVYGDHNGEWVDETTETRPVSKRSKQRVAAENAWQGFADARGVPLAIFRLSGIYGPGRNAFMNIEKGTARRLVKPGQVFNRIHREDIGEAVALAMAKSASGIFNITDDEPAPPQDVVAFAHELAGTPPPDEIDFETAELSPMARSFYGENKRVSNARSKEILGLEYRWPNYRIALNRMWQEKSWQPENA